MSATFVAAFSPVSFRPGPYAMPAPAPSRIEWEDTQ
jgi:hypothetical protein